jgi:hypothetical protein
MNPASDEDRVRSVIWTFSVRGGELRLHVANVPRSALPDLHNELRGCSLVADDSGEFLQLAGHAIRRADAVLADVISGSTIHRPLKDAVRSCAEMADPIEAVRSVIRALVLATDSERNDFISGPAFGSERSYLTSLLHSLDSYRSESTSEIGKVLRLSPEQVLQLGASSAG